MKTIIITGANSGIGYETAKHLALQGNTVVAASRKKEETLKVVDSINQLCNAGNTKGKVVFYDVDLMNLKSVDDFAAKLNEDFPIIDILICNAGVMNAPYKLSVDGYESHFQTNYLSHFFIITKLINNILKSGNPKVINVCSASAEKGTLNTIKELEKISTVSEVDYTAITSYRESKLAQQTSIVALSRLPVYKKIKFSLIHPGIVNTNLFYRNSGPLYKAVMTPFVYLGYLFGFFKTPKQGAETTLFLVENDDYETGHYWHKTNMITPNPISQNKVYANELYTWSKNLLSK